MPLAYGLIEPADLPLPSLHPTLDGLRVAHLSDLHIRRHSPFHDRLLNQLTSLRFDLLALTGDYIDGPGQEAAAFEVMQTLLAGLRPRLGAFGVFGNHDTPDLRERFAELPVTWLGNRTAYLPDRPIEMMGLSGVWTEKTDSVTLALNRGLPPPPPDRPSLIKTGPIQRPLRLMLTHSPSSLFTAADLGADLVLCGHTHGGQCRLPTGHALVNSCDLPLSLSAGILRHRHTLAAVSRGVGHAGFIPRMFCRPHVPVYTLRRRTMPGEYTPGAVNLQPW